MINPHGGRLINRVIDNEEEKKYIIEKQKFLPKIILNEYQLSDLEMIATIYLISSASVNHLYYCST